MKKSSFILFLLLAALTFARVILGLFHQASPSEAYFWLLGQIPDSGYVEGPPGTALTIRFLSDLLGAPLGIALFAPLAACMASLGWGTFVRRISKEPHKEYIATTGILILNILPVFNTIATEASSAAAAVACGLLATGSFARVMTRQKPLLGWIFSGIFIGAGIYFNFVLLWMIPAFLLATLADRLSRSDLFRPGPYVAFLIVLICAQPLIQWNAAHDFIWFASTTLRATLSIPFTDSIPLLVQFLLGLSPLLALLLVFPLRELFHKRQWALLFLWLILTIGWLFSLPTSTHSQILLILSAAPLLAWAAKTLILTHIPALRFAFFTALLIATALSVASIRRPPIDAKAWENMARFLQKEMLRHPDQNQHPAFLIASNPQTAALLIYYGQWKMRPSMEPPIFVRESAAMESQFSLWPHYDEFKRVDIPPDEYFTQVSATNPYLERNALYITQEKFDDLPTVIKEGFGTVTPLRTIELKRKHQQAHEPFQIYLCTNYQTVPL